MKVAKGFSFAGIHCGFKKDPSQMDLVLIAADGLCDAAGVFTQNHFPGEPVKLGKKRLESGKLQALLINSRYSNVATGKAGYEDALHYCRAAAKELGMTPESVLVSSTGIIGRRLPQGKIEAALPALVAKLDNTEAALSSAAHGIMTTDTVPKFGLIEVDGAVINYMVKGSGMISPNMATMLAFLLTDAKIESELLQPMLKRVVDKSFNRLSVDFDTSTSDSCIIMSSAQAGPVDPERFEQALESICKEAAMKLVKDGEGVTKVLECSITGGIDKIMVDKVGRSIINSPLVKTMVTGADPNWGRLVMAVGKVEDNRLVGVNADIHLCGQRVFKDFEPVAHDPAAISRAMKEQDIVYISVDLGLGSEEGVFWGGNLTSDYVSINADYTS